MRPRWNRERTAGRRGRRSGGLRVVSAAWLVQALGARRAEVEFRPGLELEVRLRREAFGEVDREREVLFPRVDVVSGDGSPQRAVPFQGAQVRAVGVVDVDADGALLAGERLPGDADDDL